MYPATSVDAYEIMRRAILTVLLCCAAVAESALADWHKLYQNPQTPSAFRAICFLDEGFGIIGGRADQGVYITRDGGKTWSQVLLPGSPGGNISQIKMLSAAHGYLTIDASVNVTAPSLFETIDSGHSWRPIRAVTGNSTDFYITPSRFWVANRFIGGPSFFSSDGGVTFMPATSMQTNGIDFTDGLHGVLVTYKGHVWYRTTNGGQTWMTLGGADTTESWSVFALPGSSTFFTAGENDQSVYGNNPIPHSDVRTSVDNGATWRTITTLPIRTTGHITGRDGLLYVQSDTSRSTNGKLGGLFRSTDGGRTWTNVGGPSNDEDTRFQVSGCRGEIIYASDARGGLWKTDDGGDGSRPQFALSPQAVTFDSLQPCTLSDTTIVLQNEGCDTLYVTGAETVETTPIVQLLDDNGQPQVFPIAIVPGASDSIRLGILVRADAATTAHLVLTVVRNGLESPDTMVVTGSIGKFAPLSLTRALTLDTTTICRLVDSSLRVLNPSCVGVRILSARFVNGSNFQIVSSGLPDSVYADSAYGIDIRFAPIIVGLSSDKLLITSEALGQVHTDTIDVRGIVRADKPAFQLLLDSGVLPTPPRLDFGSISRCDTPREVVLTITNPGCTRMTVQPMRVIDSNGMVLKSSAVGLSWQSNAAPVTVSFGDTVRIPIQLHPSMIGNIADTARFRYEINGMPVDSVSLPILANVYRGTVALAVDSSLRTIGPIAYCETRELQIPIRNLGCDTMLVTSRKVMHGQFTDVSGMPATVAVAPNSSDTLRLSFVPTRAGITTDTMEIYTNADSTLGPVNAKIPLLAEVLPTDTVHFRAYSPNGQVKAGDTALVIITTDRKIEHQLLSAIDLTLRYNGDIMTAWAWTAETAIPGARVVAQPERRDAGKVTTEEITVLGSDMSIDSGAAVATVRFRITLSDSAQTDFHLASVQLNGGSQSYAACTLGAVEDTNTIALEFLCGDALIYHYLRDKSSFKLPEIIAPTRTTTPNPIKQAQLSSAIIPVEVRRTGRYVVRIFDSEGNRIATFECDLEAGSNEVKLGSLHLASGRYHYSIEGQSNATAQGDFVVIP